MHDALDSEKGFVPRHRSPDDSNAEGRKVSKTGSPMFTGLMHYASRIIGYTILLCAGIICVTTVILNFSLRVSIIESVFSVRPPKPC